MSTNIQVPTYPNQVNQQQNYIQQPQQQQQLQPHEVMGGHYNPHQQNQVIPQQVHYDNFNQMVQPVEVNASKSVTFIADAISLEVMKECDNIHINTLINMGIRLAKDHSFYKQFLVNKENYDTLDTSCDDIRIKEYSAPSTPSTQSTQTTQTVQTTPVGIRGNNSAPVVQQHVVQTTTAPTNNELDFSKMFN